jgi:hypothetical protein
MPYAITDAMLIERLKKGVKRTKDLIAHATDYHGGPTTTEYLLTADIAREFIETHHETQVEFLNRRVVNALTERVGAPRRPPLRGKRTDIVLLYTTLMPVALIEIKIGVATLHGIASDLDKITDTFARLNSTYSSKVVGAVVFQVHVRAVKGRTTEDRILQEVGRKEERISVQLAEYAVKHAEFSFRMVALQAPDAGIAASDEDNDGHATRYHVVLIRDKRPAPGPIKNIHDLKKRKTL